MRFYGIEYKFGIQAYFLTKIESFHSDIGENSGSQETDTGKYEEVVVKLQTETNSDLEHDTGCGCYQRQGTTTADSNLELISQFVFELRLRRFSN